MAEIRILPVKGKSLVAIKPIPAGTTIFEEDPLVSCQFSWNAACKYKACDHCLRPLETAEENLKRLAGYQTIELPYPECCETQKDQMTKCPECSTEYCSEKCRVLALNEYHKVLCLNTNERNKTHPLEQLEETWKQMHYPPETSSIFLIVRLLARIIQAQNKDEAVQTVLSFCHRSVNEEAELLHKFMGEKFVDQVDLLREMVANALPNEYIGQFLTPEGFRSLIALIGTNGQGVGSSAFGVWRENTEKLNLSEDNQNKLSSIIDQFYNDMERVTGDFFNNEGVALFIKQSAANHSCDPNAECQFLNNNFRLSLVAQKDIQPEDEICISYLGECERDRSRHSRRKALMENYLFVCDCFKCISQADEPDVTSEEEMSAEEDDD